jgi:hypothetical protein
MNIESNIVIFSVFQDSLPIEENIRNTTVVLQQLLKDGISVRTFTGVYKGKKEDSFLVRLQDIERAINLAQEYNQECILVRYADKSTYLYNIEDISIQDYAVKEQYIGKWSEISKRHADTLDAYTVDNGVYWAAI